MATIRAYHAWRVYDVKALVLSKYMSCPAKLEVAPSTLVRVFGPPCYLEKIDGTSGTYDFEDQNLCLFKIMDRYEVDKFIDPEELKKRHPPYSHRNKTGPFPTVNEFWASDKLYKFWVLHTHYADLKSFLRWVKNKISENVDVKQQLEERFGKVDYFDDYDKNYEIRQDYAVFKFNKQKEQI